MKIKLEMENGKTYTIEHNDSIDLFIEHVQFEASNAFLLTDSGKYVNIKKIVEFEVVK